ncbi:MAG: hypothetical protein A2Y76_12165 [Planctomycetes bacterium RBG_13_60_9]|nr:MAG: hypothetical protein A2Y76_12165 [Planctomycetes bacterium RBG_13_60_9]
MQPSRLDSGAGYLLLPRAADLTDGDAAVLYNKATDALPDNLDDKEIVDWTKRPLHELPQDKVEAVLQQVRASLQLVSEAALCKNCVWPAFRPDATLPNLPRYRQLAFLISLKARLEIAQGKYDRAIETMRTGMAMAIHVGEARAVTEALVGIAVAGLVLRDVDQLTQAPGSPNLCAAIEALPRPFVDVEKSIALELKALDAEPRLLLGRGIIRKQMEDTYVRVRQLSQRSEALFAAHQCVQALRHYAATHDNRLPAEFGDITDVKLPNDPVSGRPFAYRLDGTKAILDVSAPQGAGPGDALRCEIEIAP